MGSAFLDQHPREDMGWGEVEDFAAPHAAHPITSSLPSTELAGRLPGHAALLQPITH